MQEYGSGRQRLGIPTPSRPSPPPSPAPTSPPTTTNTDNSTNAPKLKEYLEFGKLLGDRVQDVKRQLEISGTAVTTDQESQEFMDAWENQQMRAYSMFESLVSEEMRGKSNENPRNVLQRNKNRLAVGPKSLQKFVEREFGSATRPLTAAERKLAKNKNLENKNFDKFELVAAATGAAAAAAAAAPPSSTAPPQEQQVTLVGKPLRPFSDDQVRNLVVCMCVRLGRRKGGTCHVTAPATTVAMI